MVGSSFGQGIPGPLPGHPGNVFLRGESVSLQLPERNPPWRLVDYDGVEIGKYAGGSNRVELGTLPVGFYRFLGMTNENWISCAVLEPLRAPISPNSPISLDAGLVWGVRSNQIAQAANIARLAGVNWIRDRMNWSQIQTNRNGPFVDSIYDYSIDAQSAEGLRVLEVIHETPGWAANGNPKRFPQDLRDAFEFFKTAAARWRGKIQAFEPWNEADGPWFGGHTGSEMAAYQKAAYLGLKAGNPDIIVCQSAWATHRAPQLQDFNANEVVAYYDTFNFHHYENVKDYPPLYSDFRAKAAGKPLWATEVSIRRNWSGNPKFREFSDENLKLQADSVVKCFASALYEGSSAAFYFMLRNVVEGPTQFGLLRTDLTPRPAYVALAATGRLLMDARPKGRLKDLNPDLCGYLFSARPDGRDAEVLVVWSDTGKTYLQLAAAPVSVFDGLGRPVEAKQTLEIGSQPVFVILAKSSANKLVWTMQPKGASAKTLKPASVVLQALWPQANTDNPHSVYNFSTNLPVRLPVYVYNFGAKTVRGKLTVGASKGWSAVAPAKLEIKPMDRVETFIEVRAPRDSKAMGTITARGDFGSGGKAVLSAQLSAQ